MAEALAASGQVVRIWHPSAPASLIHAADGSGIEVLAGEPAYQLTSGVIVVF